jgi:hypothetical protein
MNLVAGGLGELVPGLRDPVPSRSETIHVCRLRSSASDSASDIV